MDKTNYFTDFEHPEILLENKKNQYICKELIILIKQVRDFLKHFNGVSSKYLQNYLNWYTHIDKTRNSKTIIKQWFITMLLTGHA